MKKLIFIEKTRYSNEEQVAISQYFIRNFGIPSSSFYPEMETGENPGICFLVIPSSPERNFQILVSVGFGVYKLDIPGGDRQRRLSDGRSEIMIFLPPDFDLGVKSGLVKAEDSWLVQAMMKVIQSAIEEDRAVVAHDVVSDVFALSGSRMRDAVVLRPFFSELGDEDYEDEDDYGDEDDDDYDENDDDEIIEDSFEEAFYCELPDGDRVEFLQLVPIYPEELDMLLRNEEGFFVNLYQMGTAFLTDLNRISFSMNHN